MGGYIKKLDLFVYLDMLRVEQSQPHAQASTMERSAKDGAAREAAPSVDAVRSAITQVQVRQHTNKKQRSHYLLGQKLYLLLSAAHRGVQLCTVHLCLPTRVCVHGGLRLLRPAWSFVDGREKNE